ncbi:reverse gyrase [Sulfurisphaera ohwakuensis]|uniref:Reverse gyrase n=1 Tax=Sulfurisphaera ohwakuensis TaxID=69656 RepID=A0A650CE16_SULOH|nr:reverse gyrase [Sulfurisphaera ohwakuensis]MBB5253055.1 reverse gyrase [Sulfurisphaera ohwakuensis]QGR16022.1 reverse gyrase [Sulfurisphaera ohwakuensis]
MNTIPSSNYLSSCPNCGRVISAERLYKGSVCSECLEEDREFNNIRELVDELSRLNKLNRLSYIKEVLREYDIFVELFKRIIGFPPFGPQKSWIIRVLRKESFAIIAPPGLGKTTFGIITSLYFSSKNFRSILIFPTRSLVKQAVDRISMYSNKTNIETKLLYYHSGINESQKQELYKALNAGDFNIFIATNRFFIDKINELKNIKYDFMFVDDVDTALKSSKSAETILNLAGFSKDDILSVKELLRKSREDESVYTKIQEIRGNKLKGKTIVFSSATLTRGNPVLSALMGFRPGSSVIYLRKIIDTYAYLPNNDDDVINLLKELLNKLGEGGLIFVPVDKGQEYAKFLEAKLSDSFNVVTITSSNTNKIEDFANGNIYALIGSATHYGILVRGIDIPWRVKYAIFVGIPKFKFKIGEVMNLVALSRILSMIGLITKDQDIVRLAGRVRGKLRKLSPAAISMLTNQAREGKLEDETLLRAYEVVNKYLEDKNILKKIAELGDLVISNGYILMPDYLTYIQASGRTSRIYGGELTTGLSVLLIDDINLFNILNRKLSLILDEIIWQELQIKNNKIGSSDLTEIINKINEERERILKVKKEGEIEPSLQKVKTVLFIVESPNKAKTISNFFAKPSIRQLENIRAFETVLEDKILIVAATGGHVYDLTTQNIGIYGVEVQQQNSHFNFIPYYNTIKKCINGHQFTDFEQGNQCPKCHTTQIILDKTATIDALRKLALEADEILIGTDPDTEGEKIAWDIYLALKPFNSNIKRAEFHEVTRKAILQAINNPRPFNVNLVKSQIVRRIEDRWIGFKLSTKLQEDFWKEYCKSYNCKSEENKNLSAGRVQSPVLNWIVNRYEEYNANKTKIYYGSIKGINELKFYVLKQNEKIRKNANIYVKIINTKVLEEEINPLPPYTTDTLLYDANQFYGISASETMKIAQDLFELGLITYHRTDSTRISNTGISIAEGYLKQIAGENYTKIFKPRSWGEGGAHEAIRPTRPLDVDQLRLLVDEGEIELAKKITRAHFLIYDLIFRRFITSQLAPLKVIKERIEYKICEDSNCNSELKTLQNYSEFITDIKLPIQLDYSKFLYLPTTRIIKNSIIKKLQETTGSTNAELVFTIQLTGSFVKSTVNLYTQAELVAEMKRKEIGRPSTYATIISTILKRGYVIESKKTKKLIPTQLGKEVNKYLNQKFSSFVSEERTRNLLQLMDMVEQGKQDYIQILKDIYYEIKSIR